MAIRIPPLPQGTRVRVIRSSVPQDPELTGRTGTVVASSEYQHYEVGVVLDDDQVLRYFMPSELEITEHVPVAPERIAAKQLRALP